MKQLIVSLFSGAGGFSTGFSAAGLAPVIGVELDHDAARTYRENVRSACVELDVSLPKTTEYLQEVTAGDEIFAVIGGPPCQGFSTAGARLDSDPRNRLIFSYLTIIERLEPRWFVFENVEGLLTASSGHSVTELARLFMLRGYSVSLQKINCAGYGLPQTRKRVIIVGNRLGIDFRLPPYTHSVPDGKHRVSGAGPLAPTVTEALAGLGPATLTRQDFARYDGPSRSSYDERLRRGNMDATSLHYTPKVSESDLARMRHLAQGQSMRHIPPELWPETFRSRAFRKVSDGMPPERRGGAPHGLKRLRSDAPSLTITSLSRRELIHPHFDRPLTLRECARLQSFPDRYNFHGSEQSIARQIGNAVPPLVGELIAREVARYDREAKPNRTRPTLHFNLSDSDGRSPALATTELLLSFLSNGVPDAKREERLIPLFPLEKAKEMPRLTSAQSRVVTRARQAKPVQLSDRELARLLSILLHDLGRAEYIPSFVQPPKGYTDYYHVPLPWFVQDEQRPFDFPGFYSMLDKEVEDFETLFQCITQIHKRRRKFDYVIRAQPRPTMDQVARKGLLEYGVFPSPALTSWLVWRKWVFDLDARSAQETGYLFDPILAAAVGGISYPARSSPIQRLDREGGRQVDCIIDDGDRKVAYEFKTRLTTASSGQGRWREELSFPLEASSAGYKPILLVLDPTENDKLAELRGTFSAASGETYTGEAVWLHLESQASATMKAFIARYVRSPIEQIISDETQDLPDALLSWDSSSNGISLLIGEQRVDIQRFAAPLPIEEPEVDVSNGDDLDEAL